MKATLGKFDRVLRVVVGLGLISLAFLGSQTPWRWIGPVPLATALTGWWPGHTVTGISSNGKEGAA
jgi:hypothetical protein